MYKQLSEILKDEFANCRVRKLHIASDDEVAGFVRERGKCHCNAKRWAENNTGYKVVEGWVAQNTDFWFVKHSAVEDSDGRLTCVTLDPKRGDDSRVAAIGFVTHQKQWTSEAFADLPPQVCSAPKYS